MFCTLYLINRTLQTMFSTFYLMKSTLETIKKGNGTIVRWCGKRKTKLY